MKKANNIFIAYEIGHLDEASNRSKNGASVVCLDFLIERECKKRNIPFEPLRNFVDAETGEEQWWVLSHDIPREWYRLPGMDFFQHRGIRIAEAPEPIFQAYLAKLFYFVRIFIMLKKAYPKVHFSIPNPISTNNSNECLMAFQPWAVLDAACMVGLINSNEYRRTVPERYIFDQSTWKTWFLDFYNFFISLLPSKNHKVYMSGYWTHAESLVPLMNDTEIIVLETKKFREITWRQLFIHRMRFLYSHGPVSASKERAARGVSNVYMEKWEKAQKNVAQYLSGIRSDLNWDPVLDACRHIVWYAPRVVADIDTLFGVMRKEKPDIVLQMASVGGPHHYFFLMARVAAQLGIISVELQHATVTSDPRSVFCRIETDYLLTYGPSINMWHERIGSPKHKLIPTGSPRFDKYVHDHQRGCEEGKIIFRELGLNLDKPVLLVAVPFSETYASSVDSYQLAEFFCVIQEVQKRTPGLQVLFKCRVPKLVEVTKEYLKELFFIDWAVTGSEDIFPLICASDAVICNNSTVIYQAVLVEKPLVLYPWKRFDSYHAAIYSEDIPLLHTTQDAVETMVRIFADSRYCSELLDKQRHFLQGYMLDGGSSERVSEMIKKLIFKRK